MEGSSEAYRLRRNLMEVLYGEEDAAAGRQGGDADAMAAPHGHGHGRLRGSSDMLFAGPSEFVTALFHWPERPRDDAHGHGDMPPPDVGNMSGLIHVDAHRVLVEVVDDDAPCSVCYEPFRLGTSVGSLPCGHAFHFACISTWMQRSQTCPLCRKAPGDAAQELTEERVRKSRTLTRIHQVRAMSTKRTAPSPPPSADDEAFGDDMYERLTLTWVGDGDDDDDVDAALQLHFVY